MYSVRGANFRPVSPLTTDGLNYLQTLDALNVNHVRAFSWEGFDISIASHRNLIAHMLDNLAPYGITATICLTANLVTFLRGYFDTPSLSISDFDLLNETVGEHPNLDSWDLHNEPKFYDATADQELSWISQMYSHIKSVSPKPAYVSLGGGRTLNGYLERIIPYSDICAVHYYPWRGSNSYYMPCWIKQNLPDDFANFMDAVTLQNNRNLPVWIDEYGAATKTWAQNWNGYTSLEGQDYQYRLLYNEFMKYPEIEGCSFWQINKDQDPYFSVIDPDFSWKPVCSAISQFYGDTLPDVPELECPTPISPLFPLLAAGLLGTVILWWLIKK